jgi:hypothetical protein
MRNHPALPSDQAAAQAVTFALAWIDHAQSLLSHESPSSLARTHLYRAAAALADADCLLPDATGLLPGPY